MKTTLWTVFFVMVCSLSCKVTTSKMSSATIKFPDSLPSDVKGYSICLERIDENDSKCSDGFITKRDKGDNSIDIKLKKDCEKGYRLKMWLWDDDNKKATYGMDTKFGSDLTYDDGYVKIPKEKLTGSTLTVKLHFVSGTGSSTTTSDEGEVDVEIETILGDGTITSTPDSGTTVGGTSVDTSCKATKELAGSGGKDPDSKDKPDGTIIALGEKKPDIKSSNYPSMVIYTFTSGCPYCEDLVKWIKDNSSKFKDKMFIYQNDVAKTGSAPSISCSGDNGRPVVEFYKKDGTRTSDCLIGFSSSSITQAMDKLTN